MGAPKGSVLMPVLEKEYGAGIRAVVARLYDKHGNLSGVADELNVSRVTLYKWLGRREIAMLRAQSIMRVADSASLSIGR